MHLVVLWKHGSGVSVCLHDESCSLKYVLEVVDIKLDWKELMVEGTVDFFSLVRVFLKKAKGCCWPLHVRRHWRCR